MSGWRKKRSIMRRYDLTSQIYDDRYRQEQEAKYAAALIDLQLLSGDRVLDVGCGSGLLFPHLAGKTMLLVGVDASLGLLKLARERAKPLSEAHVVLADADHLPFKERVFSNLFVFTILQNMPKPAETLKELEQAAKLDANFVVTGLKAAISLAALSMFLEEAGLKAISVAEEETLRCYVVRAIRR